MRNFFAITCLTLTVAMAGAQGGFGGGGGQGGMGGSYQGGVRQESYDRSVSAIEQRIRTYLDGTEIKNILTPGEYSEWNLPLKEGQVVIAEARSDAFDPALEVFDGSKVRASNDDRYPGDQRPLLLWRCDKTADYSLRARCFHDKSGGQFFLRYRIYDAIDVGHKPVEKEIKDDKQFLLRVPMNAGEVDQLAFGNDYSKYRAPTIVQVISQTGLPDISLAGRLANVITPAVVAPVAGDYYILCRLYGAGMFQVHAVELMVQPIAAGGSAAKAGSPTLWTMTVKKGDFLRLSIPELSPSAQFVVTERPDFSKYDSAKPELNPFFPKPGNADADEPDALATLPARPRDHRYVVFVANRDATLWVAADDRTKLDKTYHLQIEPAARPFTPDQEIKSPLRTGDTDYWTFDSGVGDVMTFKFAARGFAEHVVVMGPDLEQIYGPEAGPDEAALDWSFITQKPGRYLVSMSSVGYGGGGEYAISRSVHFARLFDSHTPAKGEIKPGEVHVWKFTAKPGEPMLVHETWKGSFPMSVRNQDGNSVGLGLQSVDANNAYGILTVDKPRTYLIVIYGGEASAQYSIELGALPGYKR